MPGFVARAIFTDISEGVPRSCELRRVRAENPYSGDEEELAYEVIFDDGPTIIHFDSSTSNSVPLNHECYMIVTDEGGSHNNTPIVRGTAGAVDPKENRLIALKSQRFNLEVDF